MQKTIGWILLVMSSLNLVAIFFRLRLNESIGSPAFMVALVLMFFGGLILINSKKKETMNSTEGQKSEND